MAVWPCSTAFDERSLFSFLFSSLIWFYLIFCHRGISSSMATSEPKRGVYCLGSCRISSRNGSNYPPHLSTLEWTATLYWSNLFFSVSHAFFMVAHQYFLRERLRRIFLSTTNWCTRNRTHNLLLGQVWRTLLLTIGRTVITCTHFFQMNCGSEKHDLGLLWGVAFVLGHKTQCRDE